LGGAAGHSANKGHWRQYLQLFLEKLTDNDDQQDHNQDADRRPNPHPSAHPFAHPSARSVHHDKEPPLVALRQTHHRIWSF